LNRVIFVITAIVCASLVGPAAARNDVYILPLQDALNSPEYAKRFVDKVEFQFGDPPLVGYQTLGEYTSAERNHFHGRSEQETCKVTLLDALEDLRDRAKHAGGDAVIGIVSDFRSKTFSSAIQYECHAGSSGVFVTLKGEFAKKQ